MSIWSSTGAQPPFDPSTGVSLVPPPGAGPGHWAGAPGAFVDGEDVFSHTGCAGRGRVAEPS